MTDWFAGVGGQGFATAVIWTLAALILLVIVLVVVRLVRSMTFGTFVAGGRNRKTRLAVMDATAVDSHRRLVLVRRDDIEHLLLIGGPTDVVVEREIRMTAGRRNHSVFDADDEIEAQGQAGLPPLPGAPQAPPPRQRAPEPAQLSPMPLRGPAPQQSRLPDRPQQPARQPERPPAQPPRPARPPAARPPVRETPQRAGPSRPQHASLPPLPAAMSSGGSKARPQPASQNSLDDALLRELQVTFDSTSTFETSPASYDRGAGASTYNPEPSTYDPAPSAYKPSYDVPPAKSPVPPAEMTLDDEMTKLLGELSNNKR